MSTPVLLIGDDPLLAETVGDMLRRLDHKPDTTFDGLQALHRMAEGLRPRLVLTDLQMPGMGGLEVIQHFREHWPGVPVVAMAGEPDPRLLTRAEVLGARATLRKPFTLHQLGQTLAGALA